MRKHRDSKIQWGQTGRHRRAATFSGVTPCREGGPPRGRLVSPRFRPGLHRTVLELERAETLTREFLIRRAKSGDGFAARLLRDRYRLRVATLAEVRHENQRRALEAPTGETGAGHPEQAAPAPLGPEPR
jgi:hypothetical protein